MRIVLADIFDPITPMCVMSAVDWKLLAGGGSLGSFLEPVTDYAVLPCSPIRLLDGSANDSLFRCYQWLYVSSEPPRSGFSSLFLEPIGNQLAQFTVASEVLVVA